MLQSHSGGKRLHACMPGVLAPCVFACVAWAPGVVWQCTQRPVHHVTHTVLAPQPSLTASGPI